ncbi:MAG: hypothetical protein KKG76_04650 [Euryarchaeota archaeon]|nr:hypothetical protein [Euryarchaeota archaeon]
MYLPFGLTMTAYHIDDEGNVYPPEELEAWNESVTLVVNQEPDYLYAVNNDVELRTLGIRSFNIFGPTGLPVLPSMNPWIIQTNAWKIEVQGKINKFELLDADNEVHPNPIFGHEAQVYVREEKPVLDPLTNNRRIGNNLPLKFSFTTGTFIAVPPGKYIGDDLAHVLEETNFDENFEVNQ